MTGGRSSWKTGDQEKPSWAEKKSFWVEKLFNWMQRAKSGNNWKEHSWVKKPTTENEQKPNWAEHTWVKRTPTENSEKPVWKEHSWVKRTTKENSEKPGWKDHSWVKRSTTGENNCDSELSAKFSAMEAKMEQMAKIIQNSLSLLDKKVEGLLDQITTKSGALTKPVGHDGNQIRKGRSLLMNHLAISILAGWQNEKKVTVNRIPNPYIVVNRRSRGRFFLFVRYIDAFFFQVHAIPINYGPLPKKQNISPLNEDIEETEKSANGEENGKPEVKGGSGEYRNIEEDEGYDTKYNTENKSDEDEAADGSGAYEEEDYVTDHEKEHGENKSDEDYASSADGDNQDDLEDYSYST